MNEILKFEPIYKTVLWGGNRIARFKGVPSPGEHIGESWELSPLAGYESVVAGGKYAGNTLNRLISDYGTDIMGERLMKRFGGKFPLLVKFIDSNDDLSVQVHPNNRLAAERHNASGKTEVWYSLEPLPGAYFYAGFSKRLTPDTLREALAEGNITDYLRHYPAHKGDIFFLPPGRVHGIGRGSFLLEIQEASDITYRIYDYGRLDANGQPRRLHIDESIEAINFDDTAEATVPNVAPAKGVASNIADCECFTVDVTGVEGELRLDLAGRDSFTILIAVEGALTVEGPEGAVSLGCGETVLIPASLSEVTLRGKGAVVSTFIR